MKEPEIITLEEFNKLQNNTNFMYNYKTGQIAIRDWDLIFPPKNKTSDWHCITNIIYPVFENGVYVGDSLD